MRDALPQRLLRRAVTVPAVVAAAAVAWALLPVWLMLALAIDLASGGRRRRHLGTVRIFATLLTLATFETLGIVALFVVFVLTLGAPDRRTRFTAAVQARYVAAHFGMVRLTYRLELEVEGADAARSGRALFLFRHASIIDTLLPGALVSLPHGLLLRYVLKRELLAAPCLDIAGHFLKNHFVDRSGADSAQELASIRALASGVGPDEGVVLYPEGTRFSEERRRLLVTKLADKPVERAKAEALRHLLPVRPGGASALFEAAPDADLVLVAHTGLEGFARLTDVWAGGLVGRTVRVRIERIAATQLPPTPAGRLALLEAKWSEMDAWLDQQAGATSL